MKIKYILIIVALIIFILLLLKYCNTTSTPQPPLKVKVDCNEDEQALTNEVEKANMIPGAKEFIITGECIVNQPVTIDLDNQAFKAKEKAIIKVGKDKKGDIPDIPVFHIVGAQGITLERLEILGGNVGVLVTPRKKRNPQLGLNNVKVTHSTVASLCIIGTDKKPYISQQIDQQYETFNDCPLPPGTDIESLKAKILSSSKKSSFAISGASAAESGSLEVALVSQAQAAIALPPGCTLNANGGIVCQGATLNIACSDFGNTVSGIGIYATGGTTVNFFHPDPSAQCISNNNNNLAGIYLLGGSLNMYGNAILNMSQNTYGMLLGDGITANLNNDSSVISSGSIADSYVFPGPPSSTINCNDSSSITSVNDKDFGTIPPNCDPQSQVP